MDQYCIKCSLFCGVSFWLQLVPAHMSEHPFPHE